MNQIDLLAADLHDAVITGDIIPQPPYQQDTTIEEKVDDTLQLLIRSCQTHSRIISLVYAFYLGYLMAYLDMSRSKFNYRSVIPTHYKSMGKYTYDVFEFCPQALLTNHHFDIQIIRRLCRREIS
jgi:hypothetical protein